MNNKRDQIGPFFYAKNPSLMVSNKQWVGNNKRELLIFNQKQLHKLLLRHNLDWRRA